MAFYLLKRKRCAMMKGGKRSRSHNKKKLTFKKNF